MKTRELMEKYGIIYPSDAYDAGYKQGRQDEREHILHLIEDGVWKDVDMLVEQIKEQKNEVD